MSRRATVARVVPETAAIENLLRLARSECDGTLAFAALRAPDGDAQTVFVPRAGAVEHLSHEALDELVRQASMDPEFLHARVLVRTVLAGARWTLAVAPVLEPGDEADTERWGASYSMIGLVCEEGQDLDERHIDLLSRLAQRLGRHSRALGEVERMRRGRGAGADVLDAAAGGSRAAADRTATVDGGNAQRSPHAGAMGDAEADPHGDPDVSGNAVRNEGRGWLAQDPLTGLPSPARFFGRAGRLLAAGERTNGTFAVIAVEVPGAGSSAAARALGAQLRFSDPLVRIDRDLFVAAVLLVPGGVSGDVVAQRLGGAVRASLDVSSPVRTAHVVAEPGDQREIDELVRQAIERMLESAGAAEPPGGGRGAPPLGSPSPKAIA